MSSPSCTRSLLAAATLVSLTLGTSGCQLLVDPFTDELAGRPPVTTPSVRVANQAHAEESIVMQRPSEPCRVPAKDGTVTHGPLYFEDPFEDKGSEDGKFAFTCEDYLQMVYWRGRFLLNAVLFPVSSIVTPPWVVMASDGRLSRQALGFDHDAERWVAWPSEPPP